MINIKLKKKQAVLYFGSNTKIAKLLDISPEAVSQWDDYVPDAPAFKLLHLSKSHKYRRGGKLDCEVKIT